MVQELRSTTPVSSRPCPTPATAPNPTCRRIVTDAPAATEHGGQDGGRSSQHAAPSARSSPAPGSRFSSW